jgi:hypothetical protein
VESASGEEPRIRVEQLFAHRHGAPECWNIGWQITNSGTDSLRLLAVRLPHGQFKSDKLRFAPALNLIPGEQTQFQITVGCKEPPGLVTENAFLIFQITWREEAWRLFVRIRVVVDEKGRPSAKVESLTTQKVGFSGVAS